LLFEREPSGLYEVRRRAVDALSALGAHDVLMDFLRTYHDVTDPIERLGEDAVINAVALALAPAQEPSVFRLLLSILRRRKLAGVVEAGGAFRRPEAIPYLVGPGNKGINFVLRKPLDTDRSLWSRIFAKGPPVYTYQLPARDEQGARALHEMQDRGTNLAANALAQSNDHILSFFKQLRGELAFYIGCLNLRRRLDDLKEPTCLPIPVEAGERKHSFAGLYDVCLALHMGQAVVGNDLDAEDKNLVVITGANQDGKSTFLRGVGLAQLMMQSGAFVPAMSFCANVCSGLFTHYKREEDATMKSGKLDEELRRMSEIVDHLPPDALLLFNESFAATNEREGSEIAKQIVDALTVENMKVFYVTHLYEFARGQHERNNPDALFLRAERNEDGTRTFKLREAEPLQTSYGQDLYIKIFETGTAGREVGQ